MFTIHTLIVLAVIILGAYLFFRVILPLLLLMVIAILSIIIAVAGGRYGKD